MTHLLPLNGMTNLIPSKCELGATGTRRRAGKPKRLEHLRGERGVGRVPEGPGGSQRVKAEKPGSKQPQ